MIRVTKTITEHDRKTNEIINETVETYSGQFARNWLAKNPEVFKNSKRYEDIDDEMLECSYGSNII